MSRYCFHDEDRRRVMQFEGDEDLQLRIAYVIAMGGHTSAAEGADGHMSEIMFRRLTITWKPKVRQRVLAAMLDAEIVVPCPDGGWLFPHWHAEGQQTVAKVERRRAQYRAAAAKARQKNGPFQSQNRIQNGPFSEADFGEKPNDSVPTPPDVNVDVNSHQHQQHAFKNSLPSGEAPRDAAPSAPERAKPPREKKPRGPAKVRPEQERATYVRDAYMRAWRERYGREPSKPGYGLCTPVADWAHRQDPDDYRRAVDASLRGFMAAKWAEQPRYQHGAVFWAKEPARYFAEAKPLKPKRDLSYLECRISRPTREPGEWVA